MPARSSSRWLIVGLVLVLTAAGLGGGYFYWTMAQAEARKELMGVWEVKFSKEIIRDPDRLPMLIITEDRIYQAVQVREGGKTEIQDQKEWASYVIDLRQKPKAIDLTYSSGPRAGQTVYGVYALGVRTLSMVFHGDPERGRPDQVEDRPDRFVIALVREPP